MSSTRRIAVFMAGIVSAACIVVCLGSGDRSPSARPTAPTPAGQPTTTAPSARAHYPPIVVPAEDVSFVGLGFRIGNGIVKDPNLPTEIAYGIHPTTNQFQAVCEQQGNTVTIGITSIPASAPDVGIWEAAFTYNSGTFSINHTTTPGEGKYLSGVASPDWPKASLTLPTDTITNSYVGWHANPVEVAYTGTIDPQYAENHLASAFPASWRAAYNIDAAHSSKLEIDANIEVVCPPNFVPDIPQPTRTPSTGRSSATTEPSTLPAPPPS